MARLARRLRAAAWLLAAGPLRAQDPLAVRADGFRPVHDALRYDISIALDSAGTGLRAEVATTWRLGGAAPLRIDLDDAMKVRRVTLDGQPAAWRREGDQIVIPVTGLAGRTVQTAIAYDGTPIFGFFQQGAGATRTMFGDNWPNRAHLWLPVVDHPGDKAAVGWRIEAPAGLTVVANGALQGVDSLPGGRFRWRFENPEPIPAYTFTLGAARMAVATLPPAACSVKCVPVAVLSYPDDSAFAAGGPFRRAGEIIDYFSRAFGAFPYAELRHVESATKYGGMENSTEIFYDEKAWKEHRTTESTVAHETAHQWFGDAVTEGEWHHVWLSEGFADYGAALWAGHIGGDSGLRATMARYRTEILSSPVSDRPVIDTAVKELPRLLNTNSYQKGAWVLHSLRGLLGDSVFFRGLQRYYRAFEHRNALSADFARVMGGEAGLDLRWYFRQALAQPGYPDLEVSTELDGGHLLVTVRQVQKPEWGLYRLPNLGISLDGRVVRVDVEGRVTRMATHWEGDRPPASIIVDPDGWWLLSARARP